jgi:hypothetical protein
MPMRIMPSLMPYRQAAIITSPSEGSFNYPTFAMASKICFRLAFWVFFGFSNAEQLDQF